MCGIVGIGGPLDGEAIAAVLARMQDAIAHRGPDDRGVWVGERFGFAMTRLAIIDLAGGHQPMWDDRTRSGIVYNGEVYNYRALRDGLVERGARFETASDTEVVLRSLAERGTAAADDWNGMFAVAWWTPGEERLVLVRDRMGVKPLYYFWDGSVFAFASEVKALLASGVVPRRANRQAIWDYLSFRYVPGKDGALENVFRLPPGHRLEWSPGRAPEVRSWWSTDVRAAAEDGDEAAALGELEGLFLDAVEKRLVAADVPVGVFLSGGLDSSAVAAAAVELGHRRFHTFSVGFEETSELPFARAVAEHIGARHHEVIVGEKDFLERLPEAVRAADEPLADLTIVPLLALSRLARESVKVVLSGEGSDELLGGYDLEVAARRWRLAAGLQRLPSPLGAALLAPATLLPGRGGEFARRVARLPLSRWNAETCFHMTRHWPQAEKEALWPDFRGLDSDRVIRELYAEAASTDPLEQVLAVYQKSWLVEDLLMKADKITMAASLELRVPFLDYRIVEWANRLPPALKVRRLGRRQWVTKFLLRRFARERLPAAILDRPKQGFPVPAYDWLGRPAIRRWAADLLLAGESRLRQAFRPQVVETVLARAAADPGEPARQAWILLVLELWLRENGVDLGA